MGREREIPCRFLAKIRDDVGFPPSRARGVHFVLVFRMELVLAEKLRGIPDFGLLFCLIPTNSAFHIINNLQDVAIGTRPVCSKNT